MDNNELISAIRNSSERAFQIVFNKYYQGLVRFACSYTENSDAAENIVQDSFVVLWEKREILEEDSNLHALLVQIVKLKVWNYIEKQRRRVLVEKSLYDNAVREMNLKLYTLDSINTTSLYIEDIKKIIEETLTELPELTQKNFPDEPGRILIQQRNSTKGKFIRKKHRIPYLKGNQAITFIFIAISKISSIFLKKISSFFRGTLFSQNIYMLGTNIHILWMIIKYLNTSWDMRLGKKKKNS